MTKRILISIFILALSSSSLARPVESRNTLGLNIGSHTEFFNGVQNDAKGSFRKFDFAPTVGFIYSMPLSDKLTFLPEINWVLPQMIEDSNIMINTFMFRADWGYSLIEWMRLRLGTSIMWQNQQGKGGKTTMNNGNGETTFYFPTENRSSYNNTLDIGAEVLLDQFAIRLQSYIYSVFKEEKRQVSYSLFLSYYWDYQK